MTLQQHSTPVVNNALLHFIPELHIWVQTSLCWVRRNAHEC